MFSFKKTKYLEEIDFLKKEFERKNIKYFFEHNFFSITSPRVEVFTIPDIKEYTLPSGSRFVFISTFKKFFEYIPSKLVLSEQISNTQWLLGDKKKVYIEHTSTNPTGPIHIGRIRGSIIGATLAKIFSILGFSVSIGYLCNDLGTQVFLQSKIFKKKDSRKKILEKYSEISKKYKNDLIFQNEISKELSEIEKTHVLSENQLKVVSYWNKLIFAKLKEYKIFFDNVFYESNFFNSFLQIKKLFPKAMENKKYSLEILGSEKILLKSNGATTYFLRDVLYSYNVCFKNDYCFFVVGQDHTLHANQMKQLLATMGLSNYEPIFFSFVLSPTGKKVSSRQNSSLDLTSVEQALAKQKTKNKKNKIKLRIGIQERTKVLKIDFFEFQTNTKRSLKDKVDKDVAFNFFYLSFIPLLFFIAETKKIHFIFKYYYLFCASFEKKELKKSKSKYMEINNLFKKILLI